MQRKHMMSDLKRPLKAPEAFEYQALTTPLFRYLTTTPDHSLRPTIVVHSGPKLPHRIALIRKGHLQHNRWLH